MTAGSIGAALGPVSASVREKITGALDERRVVVWYDGERIFGGLLTVVTAAVEARGVAVVSAVASALRARRAADDAYRHLAEPGGPSGLLIYLPTVRARKEEEQRLDPFAAYAEIGTAFGDDEAEQLRALALAALPQKRAAVERLFDAGTPQLATLDALGAGDGARYPLVRQALGTDAPVEALAAALIRPDAGTKLTSILSAAPEFARLGHDAVGLPALADGWPALRDRLAVFLLLTELAADLPDGLPPALAGVPHAEGAARATAIDVCRRLRDSDAGREALAGFARRVEADYQIALHLASAPPGVHDTFPTQERRRLAAVVDAATAGDLAAARRLAEGGADSVWRRDPERSQVWTAAARCLDFLDVSSAIAATLGKLPKSSKALIERYAAAEDGLWRLDNAQRRVEQAGAECNQAEEVDPLLGDCRARYSTIAGQIQTAFQTAVQAGGWPPEGVRRQTQTYDDRVAPELAQRRRTAYFLVDSLRYEMGRDLAQALTDAKLGPVEIEAVAAALPTSTPNGMAALLPGADGALRLVADKGELIPAIGDTPLPALADRRAMLKSRLGDRCRDVALEEILQTSPPKLAKQIGHVDLLVVRSLDLDDLGEGRSDYRARMFMTGVIGWLKAAIERLMAIGFTTFVIAADHGHVLIPEIPPGDVLPIPDGEWLLKKRRSLLGHRRGSAPGVIVLPAADLGIQSDVAGLEMAVATGMRTFRDDAGYFHEGISLPECVVPVVTLRAAAAAPAQAAGGQVTITYRSDHFTTPVLGLKVTLTDLFTHQLVVRIEAYDGRGPKANRIGEAGDCDARNPVTGEVTLRAGAETAVTLVLDPEFTGPSIEVRATDPRTNVRYGEPLKLKNARLD